MLHLNCIKFDETKHVYNSKLQGFGFNCVLICYCSFGTLNKFICLHSMRYIFRKKRKYNKNLQIQQQNATIFLPLKIQKL